MSDVILEQSEFPLGTVHQTVRLESGEEIIRVLTGKEAEEALAESDDPRPCPFCGKAPVEIELREKDGFVREHMIRCDECGIEMSEEYRSEVLKCWNTRV